MAKHYTLPSIYICVRLCCFNIMYEIILTRSTVPERLERRVFMASEKMRGEGVRSTRKVKRGGCPQDKKG
jgi:hypothetical protein